MAALKTRLDQLLVELGYFPSREKARTSIMSNRVRIKGAVINKPGHQINLDRFHDDLDLNPEHLTVEQNDNDYVSRGAYKLKQAHEIFNLDFRGVVALDLGASTGGFSDYLLKHGARQIIALDVGKGQLDLSLRQDPRVLNIEEENFRHTDLVKLAALYQEKFNEALSIDYIVADLSFISITKILDKVKELIVLYGSANCRMVFLIKPQFEAGKEEMDKCAGVIRDEQLRERVLTETISKIINQGFELVAQAESPIKGAKGNVEYLLLLKTI